VPSMNSMGKVSPRVAHPRGTNKLGHTIANFRKVCPNLFDSSEYRGTCSPVSPSICFVEFRIQVETGNRTCKKSPLSTPVFRDAAATASVEMHS